MNCCYLDPITKEPCSKQADAELWVSNTHPSLTTQACTEHVGELLSDGENRVRLLVN